MVEEIKLSEGITKLSGVIETFSATEGDNPRYKLKVFDDDRTFSGFGQYKLNMGDKIVFKYVQKDQYYNIKYMFDVQKTHEEPTEKDAEEAKDFETNGESKIMFARLLECAVKLCMKKGTMTDDEIKATFKRFLKISKLNTDYDNAK